jgi:LDH2 family malate/lactate/ureidoglycolate dehydrogenase
MAENAASRVFSYDRLHSFARNIFRSMAVPPADAELAATVLLSADLRGVDSHGVARLSGYVRLWEAGRINPNPKVRIIHETASTATVDGDSGLGLVVAPQAMAIAIKKAEGAGTGWVSVRGSNHFGIAGYHAMQALAHDMVGMAMTNASPLVAPTFSTERMLGTNPIAVAIPAGEQPPFVADFATTTVANGKLEMLQRQQLEAPQGWIQDKDGHPATRPDELKRGGALLPLGGDREHGSHKGYCLGSMVDIFSAVFSGANFGPWAPPFVSFLPLPENPVGKGLGHFFGAMRVDGFRPKEDFLRDMDTWIARFRKARVVDGCGEVLIPGDPERKMEALRRGEGIPLLGAVADDLGSLAEKFSIAL